MSIKIEKVDRIIYDISTPNSDKKIDISVQSPNSRWSQTFFQNEHGFLHVPTYK